MQGGSHVEDQEIFPQLSMMPGHERYVADVLERSELIRSVGNPRRSARIARSMRRAAPPPT